MKVLFDDLELAFDNISDESSHWVNKKNGKVVFLIDEAIVGEIDYEDEDEAEAVFAIKVICGEIENELDVEIDENRYVEVDPPDSNEKWKWMEEFTVDKVENLELHHKLADALRGRKPFRKFKDVLIYHPQEEQKWFGFENEKMRRYAEIWAKSVGLEIDFANVEVK